MAEILRSTRLGHSITSAISGFCSRITCPFARVPSCVRNLKPFSINGTPFEARTRMRPVMIMRSFSSNSTFVNFGTCTTGALSLAMFHCLPKKTAPSTNSRRERTRLRSALATKFRKPTSSKKDSMISSRLKEQVSVAVNGSRINGPPGAIFLMTGNAPNTSRRRSTSKFEKTMDPSPPIKNSSSPFFGSAAAFAFGSSIILFRLFLLNRVKGFPINFKTPRFCLLFRRFLPFFAISFLSRSSSNSFRSVAISSTKLRYSSLSTTPSPFAS
mmetsp:Transcript_30132/g.46147  ORF Transcript_30132/g.46147 Transcript_30132/m.46147 type:complete len:271 (-) Transcript_30132:51-863(-)